MTDFTKNKLSDTTLILRHRSEKFCWQYLDTILILKHRPNYCWQSVKKFACIRNLTASNIWRFVCVISHKSFLSFFEMKKLAKINFNALDFSLETFNQFDIFSENGANKILQFVKKTNFFLKKKSKKYWIIKILQKEIRKLYKKWLQSNQQKQISKTATFSQKMRRLNMSKW